MSTILVGSIDRRPSTGTWVARWGRPCEPVVLNRAHRCRAVRLAALLPGLRIDTVQAAIVHDVTPVRGSGRRRHRRSCPRTARAHRGPVPATVEVVTLVAARPEVVLDLELDVDVHTEPLAGSGESAATSTGRRRLGMGEEVTFTARHLGLRWKTTAAITALERPHRFVDEQVRGPFAAMRHEHLFEAVEGGGTRMLERMSVRAPFGPVGAVVARVVVDPYLHRLLGPRAAYVEGRAESAGERPA